MNENRRKTDPKRVVLDRAPRIPGIAAVVDKCLEVARTAPPGDTAAAMQAIDKVFKPDKLCDCLPGQCRQEPKFCKDWNKRGGK